MRVVTRRGILSLHSLQGQRLQPSSHALFHIFIIVAKADLHTSVSGNGFQESSGKFYYILLLGK